MFYCPMSQITRVAQRSALFHGYNVTWACPTPHSRWADGSVTHTVVWGRVQINQLLLFPSHQSVSVVVLLFRNDTRTAARYFFFSSCPITLKGTSSFQHVFMLQLPVTPWHLHSFLSFARTTWFELRKKGNSDGFYFLVRKDKHPNPQRKRIYFFLNKQFQMVLSKFNFSPSFHCTYNFRIIKDDRYIPNVIKVVIQR